MKRKKGFTLIEVMVALAIFSILSLMISAILIQSQRILIRTDKSSAIQDEIRIVLLKIQTEAEKYNEIVVNDKFGSFDGDRWQLTEGVSSARELLRFSNEGEDVAKVYAEVNEDNNHQFIEFNINKSTDEIIANTRSTLISNIEGNEVDKIKVYTEDIFNSKGEKINELITMNCSSIINGNIQNEAQYLITFTTENEGVINIDLGNENSNTESGSSDNNI